MSYLLDNMRTLVSRQVCTTEPPGFKELRHQQGLITFQNNEPILRLRDQSDNGDIYYSVLLSAPDQAELSNGDVEMVNREILELLHACGVQSVKKHRVLDADSIAQERIWEAESYGEDEETYGTLITNRAKAEANNQVAITYRIPIDKEHPTNLVNLKEAMGDLQAELCRNRVLG